MRSPGIVAIGVTLGRTITPRCLFILAPRAGEMFCCACIGCVIRNTATHAPRAVRPLFVTIS